MGLASKDTCEHVQLLLYVNFYCILTKSVSDSLNYAKSKQSGRLGYYSVLLGGYFQPDVIKQDAAFGTSGTIHQMTQGHTLEELNHHQSCLNLKLLSILKVSPVTVSATIADSADRQLVQLSGLQLLSLYKVLHLNL